MKCLKNFATHKGLEHLLKTFVISIKIDLGLALHVKTIDFFFAHIGLLPFCTKVMKSCNFQ